MGCKHLYSDLSVLDIREYLARKDSVIIPVGIIEQHGHHLPTFTDSIIAEGLATGVAEKMDILRMPALYTSYSGGCLPGTVNFNPCTLMVCLRDMCASLASQGFKNIFILLGHGGSENLKVLESSLHTMTRENPLFDDVMIVFTPFWKFSPTFMEGFRNGDGHAGKGETSMIMFLRPDLVRMDRVGTDGPEVIEGMRRHPDYYQRQEKLCDAPEVLPKTTQKESVRVGVMGDISGASVELGRRMVEETVGLLSEKYAALLRGRKEKYFDVELAPVSL